MSRRLVCVFVCKSERTVESVTKIFSPAESLFYVKRLLEFDASRVSCRLSGWNLLWCLQEAHRQRRRVWIPRVPAVNADDKINLFTVNTVGNCLFFLLSCSENAEIDPEQWVWSQFNISKSLFLGLSSFDYWLHFGFCFSY